MNSVFLFFRYTLLELLRRRILLAVSLLTMLLLLLSAWGYFHITSVLCAPNCQPRTIRLAAGLMLMLMLFMFNTILAISSAFAAAPIIAADIDSGVILAILPRPISRWQLIIGKWTALCFALLCYAGVVVLGELLLAHAATGYLPPHPIFGFLYLAGESIALLSLSLFASTRWPPLAVGVSVVILYGIGWISGVTSTIGQTLGSQTAQTIGTVISLLLPTDGLWRGALYNFEPTIIQLGMSAARDNPGNAPFLVEAPPTPAYVIWSIAWIATVLIGAMYSFSHRDF